MYKYSQNVAFFTYKYENKHSFQINAFIICKYENKLHLANLAFFIK